MNLTKSTFLSSDGDTQVVYRLWEPEGPVRGVVQISHGMMEHIGRYAAFAEYLCGLGYAVAGNDHLGHGETTPDPKNRGYFAPMDGYALLVEDLHTLTGILREKYPGAPLILLGHSMGSFVARLYFSQYAEDVDGAVIMGTAGPGNPVGLGIFVTGLIAAFKGEDHRSKLISKLAFGSYNKKWEKPCSEYAWLSKDKSDTDAYEADPDCHFTFTCSAFRDLFTMLSLINRDEWAETIPTDLPILLISGGDDPVGNYGKGVKKVAGMLANRGARKLTVRLFPTDRHEVLGETDRDKVFACLSEWMDGVLAEVAAAKAADVPEE